MLFRAAASCGWRILMLIRERLLPEFDAEMQSTRKLLEALPEMLDDYKPHPKSMPLMHLAGHVAQLPAWAKTTVDTEGLNLEMAKWVPFRPATKKEVLDEFDKSVKMAREAISSVSDEDLAKTWTFSMEGKEVFAMPRSVVLRSTVMNHLIHHRAQLGVYLRMLDRAIPGMYGPSADDMAAISVSK
jgi:uncharacterized damage-inducible protein DinB